MTKLPDDDAHETPRPDDTVVLGGVPGGDAPVIPDVEIQYEIGRGGMGVVYRGRQSYLSRDVAVKVLEAPSEDAEYARRFQREATILAKLHHPHIVACHSGGLTADGRCYLVMEYIDGPNLFERLEESGALTVDEALDVARALAEALGYAKQEGVIHRDVKPANVLLQKKPEGGYQIKLADLGLARPETSDRTMMDITRAGAVLGSPATMAPEQFDDPDKVDHRADIYGLGCVLFHALTGRLAYPQKTLTATIARKMQDACPDPKELRPDVPPAVSKLIHDLLAKKPADRPQRYEDVLERIDGVRGAEAPQARRSKLPMVASLALFTLAGGWWFSGLPPFANSNNASEPGAAETPESETRAAALAEQAAEQERIAAREAAREAELQRRLEEAEAEAEAERLRREKAEADRAEAERQRLADEEAARLEAEAQREAAAAAAEAERLERLRIAALTPPLAVGDVRALFADDEAFPLPEPWVFVEGDESRTGLNAEVEGRVLSINPGSGRVVVQRPLAPGPWTLDGSFRLTGNQNPFDMRAGFALVLASGDRLELLQRRAPDESRVAFTATLGGASLSAMTLEPVPLEQNDQLAFPIHVRVEALADGTVRVGWGQDPAALVSTTLPADLVGAHGAPRTLELAASAARVHVTDLRLARDE